MTESPKQSVDRFISRWQGQEGGQERANYALFLTELCDVLGLPHPDVANATHEHNDYVFERAVQRHLSDGDSAGRIDLYRRNSFVLEAKQSRWKGGGKEVAGQNDLLAIKDEPADRRVPQAAARCRRKEAFIGSGKLERPAQMPAVSFRTKVIIYG